MKSDIPALKRNNLPRQRPRLAALAWCLLVGIMLPISSAADTTDQEKPRLRLGGLEAQILSAGAAGDLGLPRFSLTGFPAMSEEGDDERGLDSQSRAVAPWTGLDRNALAIFAESNAILHLSAVAGTVLIVESGLDTQVHNFFARNPFFDKFSRPGVSFGSNLPIYLGAGLLGSGLIGGSSRLVSAGGAVLQASLLALCYTTGLKALTGRPGPAPVIYDDNEASQTFHFGFLRGGVFHGWPSGHMLANTAAITSLLSFYRESTWLKVAGGAYLGYLWLSVLSHHGSAMHWFSDTVAGVLMGYAIGSTVGRDFRERWENKREEPAGLSFSAIPPLLAISFEISL